MNLTPERIGYIGNVYLKKDISDKGFRIPSFFFDPWSYVVLFLVLIAIGLIAYLFKERLIDILQNIQNWKRERSTVDRDQ
jgi:hypothetical protein